MIKNVIDFQISSDPNLGALNKSADGSTFSIRIEEKGLGVPAKAKACTLEVIGAEFWCNTSNITTKNNQLLVISSGISQLLSIIPGLYSIDTFQNALVQAIRATGNNTFINSLIFNSKWFIYYLLSKFCSKSSLKPSRYDNFPISWKYYNS